MSNSQKIQVRYEKSPNPASMKFIFSEKLIDETFDFKDSSEAENSPLASKIFGFPWTSAVMIGPDFVTVTKQDWVEWDFLAEPLANLIREHLAGGLPLLIRYEEAESTATDDTSSNDSPLVKKIKQALNTHVRPLVAFDGGDVVYGNFQDGVLFVKMKGACAGCPSKSRTLKQGIEARMKELIPEIKEVVEI